MAISKLGSVATDGAEDSTTVNTTHTLDAGLNRIIIAIAGVEDNNANPNITGIVYDQGGDNIAMVALTQAKVGSGTINVARMFYLLEANMPSNGAKTVRATNSQTANEFQIEVICIQDAQQEAPEADEIATATSTDQIDKVITTLSNGAWIISGDSIGANLTFVHGLGQIEQADFQGVGDGGITLCMTTEQKLIAGADTQSHAASSSTSRHAMVLAAFARIPAPELFVKMYWFNS